ELIQRSIVFGAGSSRCQQEKKSRRNLKSSKTGPSHPEQEHGAEISQPCLGNQVVSCRCCRRSRRSRRRPPNSARRTGRGMKGKGMKSGKPLLCHSFPCP